MKNKINLKHCLVQIGVVTVVFLIGILTINIYEYQSYQKHYNYKINAILNQIQKSYPEVTEAELMEILNATDGEPGNAEDSFVGKYGVELQRDALILKNEQISKCFWGINLVLGAVFAIAITGLFLKYNRKKDQELSKITKYIEEINQKNYKLDIDDISEDELSILKNEIYKTTVMLKEVAEHSVKAKNDLKESLSDISHQLKTPLTSILVILDNLIDDAEMEAEVRQDFIRDIKREISNINFLVQSLLKLSKLDSDTVVFLKEEVSVQKIVGAAVQNVSTLCDLKNVSVETECVDGVEKSVIVCDFRWQVEAVTNVLKNCVEHSPNDSKIRIQIEKNQVYASISIRDFGDGIDEEDQKHIFERFYKGKNASSDSMGIGLALAKAIIENDRGHISVWSGNDGTKFIIKYFYM